MWRYLILAVIGVAITLGGLSLIDFNAGGDVGASALLTEINFDLDDYQRATDPNYAWSFPQDHGAHPDYLTEWWYYTGNLQAQDGRRFSYQFTIFRRAILPNTPAEDSEWRTRQAYLAHFSMSDIQNEQFYHDTRLGRGAAGLAGASVAPTEGFSVWIEDWRIDSLNADGSQVSIRADMGDGALDLVLTQAKPIVFQGENGLSQKSNEIGNASMYYSIPRLTTTGSIRVGGQTFEVQGLSWMDREFSTSALGEGAVGWDWFSLIFDDNRELMLYRIRLEDGSSEPMSSGLFIWEDGTSTYLPLEAYTIRELDTWRSPHTNATYPAQWELTISAEVLGTDAPLVMTVTPLMNDQELLTDPAYWEGAVRIEGDVSGYGFVELTGYATNLAGRL